MTKPKPGSPERLHASQVIARVAAWLDTHHIRYLLIGGQAVIQQGYVRSTEDIDFELALGPWEAERLKTMADELGLEPKFPDAFRIVTERLLLPLQDPGRRVGIDFAFSPSDYLDQAIKRARHDDIAGHPVAVAAVEDLVIRKVIANRPRDREDIDQLLRRHEGRVDFAYITAWLERFEEVVDQPLRPVFNELLEASRR